MSKFTLDKLKELREELRDVPACKESTEAEGGTVSPVKERVGSLGKLSPDTETPQETGESPSWLTNVKGKLVKTVDSSREKYQELKAEREKAKLLKTDNSLSLDLNLEEDTALASAERRMSHSLSEVTIHENLKTGARDSARPQSQIFEFDPMGFEKDGGGGAKTPAQDIPGQSGSRAESLLSGSTPTTDTPSKAKKRFAMSSLFSRTSTPAAGVPGSPVKEDVTKTDTPKRSVRSLLSSYVGKSSTAAESDLANSSTYDLPLNDPFSGMEDEKLVLVTETGEVDVEEGVDAAEMSLGPAELSGEEEAGPSATLVTPNTSLHYLDTLAQHGSTGAPAPPSSPGSAPPALPDLVSPVVVAILAVANFLLPLWLSGFLTGLAVAGVATYWICCSLYPASHPSGPPTASHPSHIEIHEPPAVFQAWMNLLPPQFHPYDVDTYEVRNTVSVRVSVEHHMLKIEYPEWNLPKRLNTDEVIPEDLKFLYHSDHVDLTKARISLLPEGIAGKRMFSKKYPIEIRTNGLSFSEAQQPTSLIKHKRLSRSKESINSDDSDVFKDVIGTPTKSSPVSEYVEQNKVFYLFARADREKEDVYKFLMDAHHFLTDTVLDVARKEDAITEGIDRDAGGRETVRERKSNFSDFMARVLENQKKEAAEEDACLGFLNVFLNRIFYDIHKSEQVKTMLKTRVYNKLLKIKITQWFKSIELTEINMGRTLPKVCWVSNLHQDDRGLWVEMGVQYDGTASATIETCGLIIGDEIPDSGSACVQLKALLEETDTALPVKQAAEGGAGAGGRVVCSRIVAATNSDEEDSAEEDSDSQEMELGVEQVVGGPGQDLGMGRAPGRWWEVAAQSEFVKSQISKLSKSEWFKEKTSKKMTLHLELTSLHGVMVLNIPPPPSDRLWYSFKTRPDLGLRIVPYYGGEKLGNDNTFSSRAINKIIDIVVNRLKEEIHKFVLLPNMDDIPIKIMDPFPTTNTNCVSHPSIVKTECF